MSSTPFSIKDMETTSDMARTIEQLVERTVTVINGKIFKKLRGKGSLNFTDEEWQRYTTSFIHDIETRNMFNELIIEASERGIDLNNDITFIRKFAKHFRPKHEEKKDGMAQIVQLAGMGNLERPKRDPRKMIQRIQIKQFKK